MRLYFYCITKNISENEFSLRGVDNQKIFLIHNKELYAAVSAVSTIQYEDSMYHREIHENIINYFMEKYPILPFKFNSIVGEKLGRGIIKKYYNELLKNLINIQGRVEFYIAVLKRSSTQMIGISKNTHGKSIQGGKKYYTEKHSAKKIFNIRGKVIANQINQPIRDIASYACVDMLVNEQILFRGNYLVEKNKVTLFRSKINDLEKLYSQYEFFCKGAMPPYSFNIVDITKTNSVRLKRLK
ncbi:GvpL/GvpF family gas vesicle protein [candidate division KSB1 bacterium]